MSGAAAHRTPGRGHAAHWQAALQHCNSRPQARLFGRSQERRYRLADASPCRARHTAASRPSAAAAVCGGGQGGAGALSVLPCPAPPTHRRSSCRRKSMRCRCSWRWSAARRRPRRGGRRSSGPWGRSALPASAAEQPRPQRRCPISTGPLRGVRGWVGGEAAGGQNEVEGLRCRV